MQDPLLDALKSQDVDYIYLFGIPAKYVINMCIAWSQAKAEIESPHKADKPQGLWEACIYDNELFYKHLSFIPEAGTFKKLIDANIIYPDGTYNRQAIEFIQQMEVEACKKNRWNKN